MGYPIPWIGPGYVGDGGADDVDDASSQQAPGVENGDGYGAAPYDQQAPPLPPYPQMAPAHAAAIQSPQEAVTLIFKDGRPPEQIHNYILTGTTLYVGDRRPSEIPLGQLDLAETTRVNRDAGVDFQMPAALK